jgi:AcrR family transcriptional regulator
VIEKSAQAADTKERIIAAAESLFMERGFAATSLRMITASAGVNLAAVNYHFGSKEALIREVFECRLGPLNAARVAYLDRLEQRANGRALAVEQIIEAILVPALEVTRDPLTGGSVFLRLLGRAFSEPVGSMREVLPAQYREVVVRFKEAFVRALPAVPEQELTWRMHFMFGALSYTMAGNDSLRLIATCNLDGADDAEAIIRRLVPFLAGVLTAPLPQQAQAPGKRGLGDQRAA